MAPCGSPAPWLALLWIGLAAASASAEVPIRGRVTTADGGGVGGVPVVLLTLESEDDESLRLLDGQAAPAPAAQARTGDDGGFTLLAPAPGMWEVELRPAGFTRRRLRLEPLTGETVLPTVTLAPEREIEVRVADAGGRPVAGARVRALDSPYPTTGRDVWGMRLYPVDPPDSDRWRESFWRRAPDVTAAGEDGRALVRAAGVDTLRLRALAPPGAPPARSETSTVQGDEAGVVRLRLGRPKIEAAPPFRTLAGQVVDAGSRAPLAGALVWQDGRPDAAVSTDRQGRYTVPFDPAAPPTLLAWAEGYRGTINSYPFSAPALALDPAAAVRGLIVGAGAPSRGPAAKIDVDMGNHVVRFEALDGRFYLGRLSPDRTYRLSVLADGYAVAQALVQAPPAFATRSDVRIALARGRPGRGRVHDASGRPVAGARVAVVLQDSERATSVLPPIRAGEAVSDGEGRFELPHLPQGFADLVVTAPGYVRLEVPGVEARPGTDPIDLGTLVLEDGAAIAGRVVGRAGEGVAAAQIFFDDEDTFLRTPRAVAVAGDDGRFAIADLRPGEARDLRIEARGYAPLVLPGVEAPASGVTAALVPGARVTGRVVDEEDRPVVGAELFVVAQEPPGELDRPRAKVLSWDVRPDVDGRFTIEDLEPRLVSVTVQAPGFVSASRRVVLAAGETVDFELVLGRGAVVTGTVREADGRPVQAHVTAGAQETDTDADGRFRLSGVPLGDEAVHASGRDGRRASAGLRVGPGENQVDVRFPAGVVVSGLVTTSDGGPASGVGLSLERARERLIHPVPVSGPYYGARSRADGSFVFEHVAPGSYRLSATRPGTAETVAMKIEVAGDPVTGLDVRFAVGGAITGRILGAASADLGGLKLTAFGEDGGGSAAQAQVSRDGSYRISPLAPGEWDVYARLRDGRSVSGTVTLAEGQDEALLDLELAAEKEGLVLTGQVLVNGEPRPGMEVAVIGGGTDSTDHEGRFRVAGLEPGVRRLRVSGGYGRLYHEEEIVLAGDDDVTIELAAAPVAGHVFGAGGEGPLGASVELERPGVEDDGAVVFRSVGAEVRADFRGAFAFGDASPGAYRVSARMDGYVRGSREFEVSPERPPDDLELRLEPTPGLTFEVRLPSGEPAAKMYVRLLDAAGSVAEHDFAAADAEGRVTLPSVAPGAWRLLVKPFFEEGPTAEADVTVPGAVARVELPEWGTVAVLAPDLAEDEEAALQFIAPDGRVYRDIDSREVRYVWPLEGGRPTVVQLPAGAWTARATTSAGRVLESPVSVAMGEEVVVTLTF